MNDAEPADDRRTTMATVTIRRRVRPGLERTYEAELAEVLSKAATTPGWLGASVLAGEDDRGLYDMRLHFANPGALDSWNRSDTRQAWLRRLEELSDSAEITMFSAQDAWLVPPHTLPVRPPPKHKVALLTWLGIYPLITTILAVGGPYIEGFPVAVRSLVLTVCVIPLMTWVVMPLITRVTANWLHARPRTRGQHDLTGEHR